MTIIIPLPAIMGGVLAACLYVCVAKQWLVGISATFLPLFVIALSGMIFGRAGAIVSACVTALCILFLIELSDALLIIATQLVPITLMIRALMVALVRQDPPKIIWASLGSGVIAATLYGALYYAAIIATENALYQHIVTTMQTQIQKGFSDVDPELVLTMEQLVKDLPHLILALEYWGWVICVVGVILFAQYVAETFQIQRRPMPRLSTYTPPNILLAGLGLAGILNLTDYAPAMQAGQAASIILLLPYFFSGLSVIHAKCRKTGHAALFLSVFYVFFIITIWPFVFVTCYGLVRHVSHYTMTRSKQS